MFNGENFWGFTMLKTVSSRIAEKLLSQPYPTKKNLDKIKVEVCREFKVSLPKNSEILKFLEPKEREKFLKVLRLKPVRTISGVTIVTVMVKPHPCPHGRCIYCPGGPQKGTPSAYTGHEPACMRGIQNNYDPYLQVKSRLNQLMEIGHEVDKVELIILGGNFTYLPEDYQENFIKNCLDATNDVKANNLEEAKILAETAKIRNSGITVETRPDLCKEKQVNHLLNLGVTRIELGVQTIYDEIYKIIERGHTVKDVVEAFRISKDAGFEVLAHFMPGLPGSNFEKDLEMFKTVFSDERFKPDCIKIYPTLVLEGTKLYDLWKKGEYKPYSDEEAIRLIVEVKKILPRWVRIQRVQRDIPANLIVAGVRKSNLRELALKKLEEEGLKCPCIRCREVGHVKLKKGLVPNPENIKLKIEKYKASEGEEIFLSYEDVKQDILVGLLRLRYPSEKVFRPEIGETRSMVVRVLHVYGPVVPVGIKDEDGWQHQGYGCLLLKEAEKIALEEYDAKKILILSALGVKRYYAKHGYRKDRLYVSKWLK